MGTFVLVFGGVGSAVLAGSKIGNVGVALSFGLALLAMVYAIGPISGCHVNPAVTLVLFLAKKMHGRDVAGYWIAQSLGAIAAATVLLAIAKGAPGGYDPAVSGFGANGFGAHSPAGYSLAAAFVCEVTLTAFLVFAVLGSTDVLAPVGFAGLPIGFVLAMIHLVSIPVTNTSVNPARSLGPALFVGGWALSQLWLFFIAPFLGAGITALIYNAIGRGGPVMDLQQNPTIDDDNSVRLVLSSNPN
jgi:aquaporin Z